MKVVASVTAVAVASAHLNGVSEARESALCDRGFAPEVIGELAITSYDIHVAWAPRDKVAQETATALFEKVKAKFNVSECDRSKDDHPDHNDRMCVGHETTFETPKGVFIVPNFSIWVLPEELEDVQSYILQNRGPKLSVFTHANSGCGYVDHAHLSMWAGKEYPVLTHLFGKYDEPDAWRPAGDRPHYPQKWMDSQLDAFAEEYRI